MDTDFKKIIMAVALCMLVMLTYQRYVQKDQVPPPAPVQPQAPSSATAPTGTTAPVSANGWRVLPSERPGKEVVLGDLISYKENGYKAQIILDPSTGAIKEALLSEHKFKVTDDHTGYPLLLPARDDQGNIRHSLMLGLLKLKLDDQEKQLYISGNCWNQSDISTIDGAVQSVSYRATIVDEKQHPVLDIIKTYRYTRDNYELDFKIQFVNRSAGTVEIESLELFGPTGILREAPRTDYRNVLLAFADKDGTIDVTKKSRVFITKIIAEPTKSVLVESPTGTPIKWFGIGNKYFAAVIRPAPADKNSKTDYFAQRYLNAQSLTLIESSDKRIEPIETVIAKANLAITRPIAPGDNSALEFRVYLGPIDKKIFNDPQQPHYTQLNYKKLVPNPSCSSCAFEWLNKLLLLLMTGTYAATGNYGVAIIILVLLVRFCLHPITKKGQVNMMKMTKLGPKMEEIKKKYAGNKEEIQKRTMAVYKEQGIAGNMLLGCLPMFLQMPIWIGLYTAINTNVALRHQGLLPASWHWLNDLSAPDRLIPFSVFGITEPVTVPFLSSFMGSFDAVNLLPLLLFVAMFLQMKYSPQSSMSAAASNPQAAQQQKMMKIMMPTMMLLFFYNMSSGFNLYIMSSTFAGLIEQHFIRKHLREQDEKESLGTVQPTSKISGKLGPKKKKPKPPIKFN